MPREFNKKDLETDQLFLGPVAFAVLLDLWVTFDPQWLACLGFLENIPNLHDGCLVYIVIIF